MKYCEWEKFIDDWYHICYFDCQKKCWITDTEKGGTPLKQTYKFCPTCGKPVKQKGKK